MKAKKLLFKECHLAGCQYHDVDEVWEELHVGTCLELQRDLDNRYDKNAVAIVYNTIDKDTGQSEEFLLGYILVMRMRLSPNFLKWDERISLSVESAKSIQMPTMRTRFV